MTFYSGKTLREVIRNKAAYFWKLSKRGGGGGSTRIQKCWCSFLLCLLLNITKERGGVELIPKFLDSFFGQCPKVSGFFKITFLNMENKENCLTKYTKNIYNKAMVTFETLKTTI